MNDPAPGDPAAPDRPETPGPRITFQGNLFHPVIPDGAIYVGRGGPYLPASRFQNRHQMRGFCQECGRSHDQADAVAAYAEDLESSPELVDAVRTELAGAALACWCRPGSGPCHGDVLRLVAIGVDPLAAHLATVAAHAARPELAAALVRLSHTLSALGPLAPVADGDCHVWEPQVRQAAQRAGYPAGLAQVTGFLDAQARIMVFMHHATTVTLAGEPFVIDLTAQQFSPRVPGRWFAAEATYSARLAEATGCATVSISPAAA